MLELFEKLNVVADIEDDESAFVQRAKELYDTVSKEHKDSVKMFFGMSKFVADYCGNGFAKTPSYEEFVAGEMGPWVTKNPLCYTHVQIDNDGSWVKEWTVSIQ